MGSEENTVASIGGFGEGGRGGEGKAMRNHSCFTMCFCGDTLELAFINKLGGIINFGVFTYLPPTQTAKPSLTNLPKAPTILQFLIFLKMKKNYKKIIK
jgi:hypothetical protein